MNANNRIPSKHIQFSEDDLDKISKIKEQSGALTDSQAIRYMIRAYKVEAWNSASA